MAPETAFERAVQARDADAITAALAPDVRFRSPVVFRPYEGREAVSVVLQAVTVVFEELHRQIPDLAATEEPDRLVSPFIHGIKRLPVAWPPN